jgi:hypothetical protein
LIVNAKYNYTLRDPVTGKEIKSKYKQFQWVERIISLYRSNFFFLAKVVRCHCALCFCAVFVLSFRPQAALLLCVVSVLGNNDISQGFESS